ncbi:YeiH family protein [Flavobacterium rhizosphaerae]|uniref:Sulfate exporter family transporter n=1 Tax=Flavobacterium rhizosphaerae TaxID=3163298 RepID=A0ABW8Z060_9FLAO
MSDFRLKVFYTVATRLIFIILALFCLTPWASPPLALALGIALAWLVGHPFPEHTQKGTHWLLQASVVGLGFGMNAQSALKAGEQGIVFTIISIVSTLILGWLLGRLMKIEKKTSYLISSGTAICGGSAIAAVSPVIRAEQKQISVALGVIFILNSIALILFPFIGHQFNMSQQEFGLWSAIAIHDTSSVVGAAAKYGDQALQVATTVKLARALWIIPVAFLSSFLFKSKEAKIKIPYFIGLFILAMLANSYIPAVQAISPFMVTIAKAGLTLTLFFIGCGLSKKTLTSVGVKPLIQGVALWIFISVMALWAVMEFA